MNISLSCSPVLTYPVEMKFCWIFFRIKWQSISMYFVCSWKVGLDAICRAAWLSHHSFTGTVTWILISVSNWWIYIVFICWLRHSTIFWFCSRSRYHTLFLTFPRNQITSKEYIVTRSRSPIFFWSCPVCIWKTLNRGMAMIAVYYTFSRNPL